ncbi:MAG: hypothetical protein CHACPFDD_01861 [Phycisphaerae bacterium]|nr:hypothetical protein [Phycisphaerae bacterium]
MAASVRTCTEASFPAPLINDADDLVFGRAARPLTCGLGLSIGAGEVHPEINFTLPPMLLIPETWPAARGIYEETVAALLGRARALGLGGLMVEFEHLPPMTAEPAWGAELTRVLKEQLCAANGRWQLRAALRVTIVDLRDGERPPRRRGGEAWEQMRSALEACAAAGADVLSIESTGGKEVHDAALMRADLAGIVLALGVLAPADMRWLWDQIVAVAGARGVVAGGDSACGFANTAMQLAGKRMLPDVLAGLVRAMASVRSLVAFERGATGPSKDCAYEGPVLKAITGRPISMEGRSAACAHLSPVGNIAAAMADLWSNESVPAVPLLSGPAPVASLESLAYDCRLMNVALAGGRERLLRDFHVASDTPHSAQAALLSPEATIEIARAIVAERGPYPRVLAAGRVALERLARLLAADALRLDAAERRWLDRLRREFEQLPRDAEQLVALAAPRYGELYEPDEYSAID